MLGEVRNNLSTFFLVDIRKFCLGTNQELTLLGDWDKICLGIDSSAHSLGKAVSFAWGHGELGESILATFFLGDFVGENLPGAVMQGVFR